jgi:hypothetical protein
MHELHSFIVVWYSISPPLMDDRDYIFGDGIHEWSRPVDDRDYYIFNVADRLQTIMLVLTLRRSYDLSNGII